METAVDEADFVKQLSSCYDRRLPRSDTEGDGPGAGARAEDERQLAIEALEKVDEKKEGDVKGKG